MMFQHLTEMAREIRLEMIDIYWMLIIPLVVFLIILEFFKAKPQASGASDILRRTVISILLLSLFPGIADVISSVGDGILAKLDKFHHGWEVLKKLGPNESSLSGDWLNIREHLIYFFSLLAYLVAYIGFFMAEAITHFVWIVLYIISPLMILAYIPVQTAAATRSLFRGLCQVVLWKVLWTILGALLLKFAQNPHVSGAEDYLMMITVNLCIGVSMLFIPFATKSLISDGFSQAASAFATIPAAVTGAWVRKQAMGKGKHFAHRAKEGSQFVARPMTNPITGRAQVISERLKPRIEKLKESYANSFTPNSLKKLKAEKDQKIKQERINARRRYYARRDRQNKRQAREIAKLINPGSQKQPKSHRSARRPKQST